MVATAPKAFESGITGLGSDGPRADVVIDSDRVLREFGASPLTFERRDKRRIVLDADFATAADSPLEERLNELYADCGCTVGAKAALLAAIVCTTSFLRSDLPVGATAGARCLAVVGAAAVAGKTAGLLYSRVALLRLTKPLRPRGGA